MTAVSVLAASRPRRELMGAGAILSSVCGMLAAIPALPGLVRGLLLLVFVLAGPGLAVAAWTALGGIVLVSVVPVIGLSAVILVTTVAAFIGHWTPMALMFGMALVCLGSGAIACRRATKVPVI